jgi:hypothetical protein
MRLPEAFRNCRGRRCRPGEAVGDGVAVPREAGKLSASPTSAALRRFRGRILFEN